MSADEDRKAVRRRDALVNFRLFAERIADDDELTLDLFGVPGEDMTRSERLALLASMGDVTAALNEAADEIDAKWTRSQGRGGHWTAAYLRARART